MGFTGSPGGGLALVRLAASRTEPIPVSTRSGWRSSSWRSLLRQRRRRAGLGWAVISDATPREIAGLSGGLFNLFSNLSSITTPIIIGYIIQMTGSFDDALLFIGANWFLAIMSYLVAVGEIKRLELRKPVERGGLQP